MNNLKFANFKKQFSRERVRSLCLLSRLATGGFQDTSVVTPTNKSLAYIDVFTNTTNKSDQ